MTDIFLYQGEASPNNVKLSDPTTQIANGIVHSGQAVIAAAASVVASPSAVRQLVAGVSAMATIIVLNEVRRRGVATIVASSVVVAAPQLVRNAIDLVLAAMATSMRASAVFSPSIGIYLGAPTIEARASLFLAQVQAVVVASATRVRAMSLKGGMSTRVFKSRWADVMPTVPAKTKTKKKLRPEEERKTEWEKW